MDIFTPIGKPYWSDCPVHIIGGGPSIKDLNLSSLENKGFVLGVNSSAFNPDKIKCDALFSLDTLWMRNRYKFCKEFEGQCYLAVPPNYETQHPKIFLPDGHYVIRHRGPTLTTNPLYINGCNSGYGALNLAFLKKAKEVFLWGFDMNKTGHPDKAHWHSGYQWFNLQNERYYIRWAKDFEQASLQCKQAGMKVYNCNPNSAIECFEKVDPSCIL